jgi:beta-xylosidase
MTRRYRRICCHVACAISFVGALAPSRPLCAEPAAPAPVKARQQQQTSTTYTNPLGVDLADPDVVHASDGMYYLYGTSAVGEGYRVWSSPDLVHWTPHEELAFKKSDTSWGRDNFWAPDVHEFRGDFYLYYSCMGPVQGGAKQSHRICVARSKSPLGPFVDVKAPIFDPGYATIDANAFLDDDGRGYLYFARDQSENWQPNGHRDSHLYVVPLGPDLTSVTGEPRLCVKPDQPWEGDADEDRWNEGPFVMKFRGTYILMYSAHVFSSPNYCLGFATSKNPLGPWTKSKENPILKRTPNVSGPGHNSVVDSPDGRELFCVYHAHKRLEGGGERELYIDRMTITETAGVVHVKIKGPTVTPQPMPLGYNKIPREPAAATQPVSGTP